MPLPITITSVGAILEAQPVLASASMVTSAQLALHLGQAEAKVWAKASLRYDVPISPVPPMLQSICLDLAIYAVLVKQAILANTLEDSPWPDRYKEALDELEEVANGNMPLLTSSGAVIAPSENPASYAFGFPNTAYDPTFTELDPEYNRPDPDKLQDLLDERTP